jgi:hypothetical protein
MTVMILVFQFMKLHPFQDFLMSEAHSEDIPCWTKPHGTLHVLGTSVPSVAQQSSDHYQDVIQTAHSGQPVAGFLQRITYVILSILFHLFYSQKTLYSASLIKNYHYATLQFQNFALMSAVLLSAQETACMLVLLVT